MSNPTLRLLVASNQDLDEILDSVRTGVPVYFTTPQDSGVGDPAVVFTRGALVARAEIVSAPEANAVFGNRSVFRAWVANFEVLNPAIPIEEVVRLMPDTWLWPNHPRRSFCTPSAEHASGLQEIVDRALVGPAPSEGQPPAVLSAEERTATSGGREKDPLIRKAVEDRAMALAEQHYRKQNFRVENTATRRPYDLCCTRDGLEVRVEVKGTRGDGAHVEVTIGEVLNAGGTKWRTDLFVVREIEITREADQVAAVGGKIHVVEGWQPTDEDLQAIRFRCAVHLPLTGDEDSERMTDPARHAIFTIGQKGVASPAVLRELVDRLKCMCVLDVRETPPTRGAWSQPELSKILGEQFIQVPSSSDPTLNFTILPGRILLLGTEKNPAESQKCLEFGDRHPEWQVVHIYHPRHTKTPLDEAECIAHSELVAAIRDRPNNEYRFLRLESLTVSEPSAGRS